MVGETEIHQRSIMTLTHIIMTLNYEYISASQ